MSSSEPWEPWAEAMRTAEIGDPRNGRPSWTQLARHADVSVSTVTKAVSGKSKAEPATIQALAKALKVHPETVSTWLGVPTVSGPYTPPSEAALLLSHEREAIDQLIRAIARGREDVTGNAEHPAPIATPADPARAAAVGIDEPGPAGSAPDPVAPRQRRAAKPPSSRQGG